MRRSCSLQSTVTCCLLPLLAALGTGLPSHHHADAMAGGDEARLVSADHHGHGTELVEQDDRVPSAGVKLAVPTSVAFEPAAVLRTFTERVPDLVPRPQGRAPPPGAPRAPPHRI